MVSDFCHFAIITAAGHEVLPSSVLHHRLCLHGPVSAIKRGASEIKQTKLSGREKLLHTVQLKLNLTLLRRKEMPRSLAYTL